jgi:uncharacterized protein
MSPQTSAPSVSLIPKVKKLVQEYMSAYDSSHDYNHILRVLSLSHRLEAEYRASNPTVSLDSEVIELAALLHDVGDHKYTPASQDKTKKNNPVDDVLQSFGANIETAGKVQIIVSHVSYSYEVKNPDKVQAVLKQFPELAIVQDADRLDALGAVGIGRCFTYSSSRAAKLREGDSGQQAQRESSMDDSIAHFTEKLEKLEAMMKTPYGRQLAKIRTERIRLFREWWQEETKLESDQSLNG